MSAYATATQLRDIAHQGQSSDDTAKFTPLLERASRMFDRLTGVADDYFAPRVVGSPDNPTARTFYPDGTGYLKLPPYIAGSLTTVTMPSGYTVPTYIQQNGYLLQVDSTGVRDVYTPWLLGVPVTVTAKWGYATTPVEIAQVVIEIAIALFRGSDPAFAKTAALEAADIKQELSPLAKQVIEQYRFKKAVMFA